MNGGDYRLIHQINPLFPLGNGWPFLLALTLIVVLVGVWVWFARREAKTWAAGLFSVLFRLLPLLVLFAFCLNPERISERRILQPSEVAVLLDTSLSMNLHDTPADKQTADATVSRFERVQKQFESSELLQQLRTRQKVSLFAFDDGTRLNPLAEFPAASIEDPESDEQWLNDSPNGLASYADQRWNWLKPWLWLAIVALPLGGLMTAVSGFRLATAATSANRQSSMPRIFFGLGLLVVCVGVASWSVGDLAEPGWSWTQKWSSLFSGKTPALASLEAQNIQEGQGPARSSNANSADKDRQIELQQILGDTFPAGTESRLGASLRQVIQHYSGRSLAGIVIVSDGNQNAGEDPLPLAAQLGQQKVPIQVLAVGNLEPAPNAMLVSLDAPAKVLPATPFKIRGLFRTYHLQGSPLKIQLCTVDDQTGEVNEVLQTLEATAGADGAASSFEFEMNATGVGRTTYLARVVLPEGDFDANDDAQVVEVAVVDRKNHVLLMAGGPSREFRFLRNQLYRDPMVESDVWLQSMQEGADQEASKLLTQFPATAEELDQYDCIIAFDPDWRKLDGQQARDLEQWVGQRGGGLISVAGPVFTPEWSAAPRGTGAVDPIRRLYPVSFFSQGSAQAKVGRFGGTEAFPLQFTREGTSVDFVSLTSDPLTSRQAWDQFEGVYGYYAVNEAKPGAQVFAYFSDPATVIGKAKPIYLAAQFVGKGRVFFQASGEMWRIRRHDVNYFQTYYTKLIRWASQGRLLRDSLQGSLVVDKQRCWLGDAVQVAAQLVDAQGQPLAWPEVRTLVRRPDGSTENLVLNRLENQPGEYQGNLTLRQEGQWRFFLPVPEAKDGVTLQASVSVQLSDLEKRESQRNEQLLQSLAQLSGGSFLDVADLGNVQQAREFVEPIPWRQLERIEPGVPDAEFSRRWLIWMFGLLFTYFCLGWFYRRMMRLA